MTHKLLFSARGFVGCLALLLWSVAAINSAAGQEYAIGPGSVVSIEYTIFLKDGTTVDSNVGREPFVYEVGGGKLLPALERALMGLRAGESKQVELGVEEGYGPVDERLYVEVDIEQLPEDARESGSVLMATLEGGEQRRVIVREVKGDKAVVDYNHPLAGKALRFDIKVLDVK